MEGEASDEVIEITDRSYQKIAKSLQNVSLARISRIV
jgi:hypothetical protein